MAKWAIICGVSGGVLVGVVALYIYISAAWTSYSQTLRQERDEQRRMQLREKENERLKKKFGVCWDTIVEPNVIRSFFISMTSFLQYLDLIWFSTRTFTLLEGLFSQIEVPDQNDLWSEGASRIIREHDVQVCAQRWSNQKSFWPGTSVWENKPVRRIKVCVGNHIRSKYCRNEVIEIKKWPYATCKTTGKNICKHSENFKPEKDPIVFIITIGSLFAKICAKSSWFDGVTH